jgi:hypothetical protein
MRLLLCFVFIAFICIAPLTADGYFADGEAGPAHFSSLYGLTFFYPGSNRILSLLPFVTSFASRLIEVIWIQYFCIVFGFSAGLASFVITFTRRFAVLAVALLAAVLALTLLPIYQTLFNPVHPDLFPLGLTLLALSIALGNGTAGAGAFVRTGMASILVFLTAGINPIFAVVAGAFLLFLLLGRFVCSRPSFAIARLRAFASKNWPVILLGMVSAFSVLFWPALQYRYGLRFPQSVVSNYSVGSYSELVLNWREIVKSYNYLREGLYARGPQVWVKPLFDLIVLGPFPLGLLVLWRTRNEHAAFQQAVVVMSLYAAALFAAAVTSQNAHVLLLDSTMRGRYFIGCFVLCAVALSLFVSMGLALVLPDRTFRRFGQVAAAAIALVVAGFASTAWAARSSILHVVGDDPETLGLVREIQSRNAVALVGDYWVVWSLQLVVNNSRGHVPLTVPVTVRTEAFPLQAFAIWLRSLAERDSMVVACVRRVDPGNGVDSTPPGNCEEKMAWNAARGGFLKGRMRLLESKELGRYVLSFYELSRSGDERTSACAPDDVMFRADLRGNSESSRNYAIRDGGFILTAVPKDSQSRWRIQFQDSVDPAKSSVYEMPPGTALSPAASAEFEFGSKRFRLAGDGCRIMILKDTGPFLSQQATLVTVSRQ